MDLEAHLIWANPAAEALFGRRLSDSVGMSGLELIHPDDLEMALVSLGNMHVERVGLPLELRVRTATGWRQVELIGSSADDGLLITLRDLTDRRRWEVGRGRTELLRAVLQHLGTVAMVLEVTGQVRSTSAAVTRLLGKDQADVEGCHVTTLVPGPQRMFVGAALHGILAVETGGKAEFDVDVRRSDGSTVPVSMTMVNLLDDPTVGGVVVTVTDISRRLEAERDLRSANAVLSTTLDSVADGIVAIDRDGAVRAWNRQFLEIWSMPERFVTNSDLEAVLTRIVSFSTRPTEEREWIVGVHGDADGVHSGVIDLVDGRVIECRSRPQCIDGLTVGRVWSFRDVTATRALERDLARQALHDPLTGLANQVLFRRNLAGALSAGATGARAAVVFVDLDDFKGVNDGLGHSAGDLLLVEVAARLRSVVREADTAARLGGDEFAVLLVDVDGESAALDVARRLHERLREPMDLLGQSVVPGASIGVAVSGDGVGVDGLLRHADLAMYHAKRSGRSRYCLYSPELGHGPTRGRSADPRLHGAADRGELVVHYQPIVDPARGDLVVAVEALVRWQHPERGLLLPNEFIAYAETSGLIDEAGLHVFEVACGAARGWTDELGLASPMVSVNLSPHQVLDERLPERIREVVQRTGVDPSRLVLEFTEGAIMQEPAMVARQLQEIRGSGIRLAIDDFGTGHSSLSRLQQFPINTLKIDRTFVQQVEDPRGSSLVLAVVELAHALEMLTVAEGVETEAQQEQLVRLGADLSQGFLHHRPMEVGSVTALLREQSWTVAPLR